MHTRFKLFVRTNSIEDNNYPSIILDIVKFRHANFINEGIVEAYWRGFPEETLALTIYDDEESVVETIDQIKTELGHDYIVVEQGDSTIM